jgi:hypothetical protein
MDKLIHTALNSIAHIRGAQIANAQNLANQTVPGFRRDIMPEGQAFVMEEQGVLQSRAYQIPEEHAAFSDLAGFINQTGEPLDLALANEGWFYIRPDEGQGGPALSRRGDMRITLRGESQPHRARSSCMPSGSSASAGGSSSSASARTLQAHSVRCCRCRSAHIPRACVIAGAMRCSPLRGGSVSMRQG